MSDKDICLACGCVVMNGSVWFHCDYHYSNQPVLGDPLYNFIASRGAIDYEPDSEIA